MTLDTIVAGIVSQLLVWLVIYPILLALWPKFWGSMFSTVEYIAAWWRRVLRLDATR